MTEAESTVRFALRSAFIKSCEYTGLRAGAGTDKLEDAIVDALTSPSLGWAIQEWAKELKEVEGK